MVISETPNEHPSMLKSIFANTSGNKLTPESKYKAWGEARAEILPFPTTFRFTGQRQEDD